MAITKKGESFYNLLVEAVSAEEAGYAFYKRVNEITKVPLVKVAFSALAEDELKHKTVILRFCKEKELPKLQIPKKQQRKEIFGLPIEGLEREITAYTPIEKIYDFALDFEKQGYGYYAGLKRKAKDKASLRLVNFLLSEETRHYKLLAGTANYLTKPSEWFIQEEKPVVEG